MKKKNCTRCGKEIEVRDLRIRYCEECKKEIEKIKADKYNSIQSKNNKQKAYNRAKEYIEKYITEKKYSLPYEFDKISPITSRQIIQSFRGKNWIDILKMFGKDNLLKEYIKEQYLNFVKETGLKSIKDFCQRKESNIPYQLIKGFGVREFLDYCGRKIYRNTDEDYKNNFLSVLIKYGRIPLYNEFLSNTKISMSNYIKHFEGKLYDEFIKKYVSELQYRKYLKLKMFHKASVGRQTCNIGKILLTDEQLKNGFIEIFESFKKEYGKFPSRRIFNKISKHEDGVYRKKYNLSWTEICKMYGYDITDRCSGEYIMLHKINKIMGYECFRQKTWEWLIGIKSYPLKVDGYYEKDNFVIEADGRQHEEPVLDFGGEETFKIQKANDKIKDKLIPQHGIKLIRISFSEDWFNEEYLKEKLIKNGINITNTENIEDVS
jgi:very-short-patch-repair endonuclease